MRVKQERWIVLAAVVAGALVVSLAGDADAQGRKRGPRASLASATTCALDLGTAELVITTTLTNKSSGSTVPETREGGEIQATYKRADERGNKTREFPELVEIPAGVPVPVQEAFEARFTLCDNGSPRDEVAAARELNGKATVDYGIEGGDEDPRSVTNRCTDDPDTPENEGGIKVDGPTFAAIEAACAAQP